MRLYRNGKRLGEDNPVKRERYSEGGQKFGEAQLKKGDTLQAEFTNDLFGGSAEKDRNLVVDYLVLERVGGAAEPEPNPGTFSTVIRYKEDNSNFLNPERGFHGEVNILGNSDFSELRASGYSVARSYIRLGPYVDKPIDEAALNSMKRSLERAREAGIKLILRVTYSFPVGGTANMPEASLETVLGHIRQLTPLYRDYADIVAVYQAGFIGAWGEWRSSNIGLDSAENRAEVLGALLAAVPDSRMVQLRYPRHIADQYPSALDAQAAFSLNDQSRVAHHNDCFLANVTDSGTYAPVARTEEFKTYAEAMSEYTVVGGETCKLTPGQQRTSCKVSMEEMKRFHWDYLNPRQSAAVPKPTITRWK